VKAGLKQMKKFRRPGICALYELSEHNDAPMNSSHISYFIVPKINAAGRMGDASRAVEMLVSQNREEALVMAKELLEENTRSQ
jgi:single-stranded-DNA-specific exonuclease